MDASAVAVVAASIFVWGAVAARIQRADVTAPIVFTAVGALLAALDLVDRQPAPESLKPLVEITLVWVLFSDAARVRPHDLRVEAGDFARLLGLGLPLTILAGWGLAAWLFPDLDLWLTLLIAAALAPTDAALGLPVVTNRVVPARVRRLITVESGLNDGLATPVVMLAIAGAGTAEGVANAPGPVDALLELFVGVLVGIAVGAGGGALLRWTRRRGWAADDFVGVSVLGLALLSYTAALVLQCNGFVAAFCGGSAFGAAAGRRGRSELELVEQASGLVSLLVWLAFGAIAVPVMFDQPDATLVLYAVLSLTAVRMVPVALAAIGSGLDRRTVLFVAWFGPRGLASLVFALLALDELGPAADPVVAVISVTVLLSVVAHGATSAPLASAYGRGAALRGPSPERPDTDVPVRGLPRGRVHHEVR
ncbi:cation:proton antiporter [Nocardioides mesophilus]|uniref:Cation:proton antiporter n=1 Tax=Nocardioides mesophilus TaxID=433659 RepID=A0A7G9RGW6_9ACTN|nr:cation:proton antiporter [Nocardioides mesophilus]